MSRPLMCLLLAVSCVLCVSSGALVVPAYVPSGSLVSFISPASPIFYEYNASTYQSHITSSMAVYGWKVEFAEHAFVEWKYLAGNDSDRAADVMQAFADPSITAIIANRGGWGDARMLPFLNFTLICSHPKVIMGYSDLTALLNVITFKCNIVTYHGPMGLDTWSNLNGKFVQMVLQAGTRAVYTVPDGNYTTINPGKARGRLLGGNLSVFAAIVGTPYLPPASSLGPTILFLEDVGEQPYSIDRMMTQLQLAGYLTHITGFMFGRCPTCTATSGYLPSQSFTLEEVIEQKVKGQNYPAFSGALFGHISEQITLPIGLEVEIDADNGIITFLEDPVTGAH
eukprot:TRINITY_DN1883_c0_g1_i4.p1 TRINITY_DN1883_c0_g1~~TRINITY_DN1883_c0_g1_i4.p1  ORF type:complete len:348 (+),score=80.04 TRINITY_DN1883_c0_g1_i4:25-1044(+)